MKVGIPRALMFFRYLPQWKRLLELNGHEVVLSERPRQGFMSRRQMPGPPDLCLPVRLMLMHVESLAGQCDMLFIPRIISSDARTYNCPHFLGIPDVIRALCGPSVLIVDPTMDVKNSKNPAKEFYEDMKTRLDCHVPFHTAWPLAEKALREAQRRFPTRMDPIPFKQVEVKAADSRIVLVGRPYILYEPELGGKLYPFFEREKVFLVTPEMIGSRLKERAVRDLERPIFWFNGRENVAAAFAMFSNREIDGIIQVVTFGCGPDSLMKELIDLRSATSRGKPYLSLVLDQHTTTDGLQTRLEAFLDMIRRQRRRKKSTLDHSASASLMDYPRADEEDRS